MSLRARVTKLEKRTRHIKPPEQRTPRDMTDAELWAVIRDGRSTFDGIKLPATIDEVSDELLEKLVRFDTEEAHAGDP